MTIDCLMDGKGAGDGHGYYDGDGDGDGWNDGFSVDGFPNGYGNGLNAGTGVGYMGDRLRVNADDGEGSGVRTGEVWLCTDVTDLLAVVVNTLVRVR